MTITIEQKKNVPLEETRHLLPEFLIALKRQVKGALAFHLLFLLLGLCELVFFSSSLVFLGLKSLSALILALFFLTLFSYFVLRLYFSAKKKEEVMSLAEGYLHECKEGFRYQEGMKEHHLALAASAKRMALLLNEKEYSCITTPLFLNSFQLFFENVSAFLHWRDFFRVKEFLFMRSVEEHLKVVTLEPTSVEAHVGLASAYVMLSRLYGDPGRFENIDEERWIPKQRLTEAMYGRSVEISELALEEFQIITDYAPNDPWVHSQLALSFRDLNMPEEEIQEYETLLSLKPGDVEVLSKLGMLYFQQKKNAKALRIFQTLKQINAEKAEKLLQLYGTYDHLSPWEG